MDLQRFLQATLVARESTIAVPELATWFADGVAPEWRVRGLNAAELARANDAATGALDNVRAMVAALAGDGDKAAAIRRAMGLSLDDVPADISRRIEMLTSGSVAPALGPDGRDAAVKLSESYPTTFYTLTNSIISLTGQGAEPGKLPGSGPTPA